jgi:pterin-4a-carbinolamine dehydratase
LRSDHWAYNISITPRKSQVVVELKTVGRAGLTHADFYLAMQIDAVLLTTFRIY